MEYKRLKMFDEKGRSNLKAPLTKYKTFKFSINVVGNECLSAETERENWTLHEKYGHLNVRYLKNLKTQ